MKKISIIVPTYNVEKYIAKCLDSLVGQDYKNFDIIVVNDGSPYNEQDIIDEYVLKYPSLVKSIVKENGGYGSALEAGFEASDADYVLICDPDDYLRNDALSILCKNMEKCNADLSIGAKNLIYSDDKSMEYHISYNSEYGIIKNREPYDRDNKNFDIFYFIDPSPHSKLYRRDVVKEISFPHKCSYSDNLLYFYALSKAKTVVYDEEPLAYYLINRVGNTSTDIKPKVIDDHIEVFTRIMEQAKTDNPVFYYRMYEAFLSIYYKIDDIACDHNIKMEKYDDLYNLLFALTDYKNEILECENRYKLNSKTIRRQKEKLLTKETSRKEYNLLIDSRLHPNIINRIKLKVFG